MPKCKNDPTRTYKGDEPSPKGLGYCAHTEKLNSIKKGKDGNKWLVSKNKNGTKRWTKVNTNKITEKNIDKIKLFMKSNNSKKIILKYIDNFNNIWLHDLKLTSKKLKKINSSIVKKAILKYLNSDIKFNPDREEIIKTGKWVSYNDTLVRDKIIDFVIQMI